MKKLLFSILAVGMSLVGCTDWDDAVSENYGSGPAISVNIDATTDYGFTFTLSPASGTVFYSYIVAEGDAPAALDGQALLKQQYSGLTGGLLNATENSTYTLDLSAEEACEPNTSWKKTGFGRNLFDKMLNLTVNLGGDGATLILSPFPVCYGTIVLGVNTLASPVLAFFSKGGHVNIPVGTEFVIKVKEDVGLYY